MLSRIFQGLPDEVEAFFRYKGEVIRRVELVKSDCISSVYSLCTQSATYVLKSSSLVREGKLTCELSDLWPDVVPHVHQVWGKHFLQKQIPVSNFDYRSLGPLIRKYSTLQYESSQVLEYFELMGLSYFKPKDLALLIEEWIPTDPALCKKISGRELRRLLSRVRELGVWIESAGVPLSLEHGDLHKGNIVGCNAPGLRIIDWSEASITHPFFSLFFLLWEATELAQKVKEELIATYLGPWEVFGSHQELRQLMRLTDELALCFYAYRYYRASNKVTASIKQTFIKFYTAHLMRFLNYQG